jgi:putative DNA primase/helicase
MINLKFDGHLPVATSLSRLSKTWKNGEMLWSTFVNRISETQRTAETVKQYRELKKPMQDAIKDVGGFFGGYLVGGKRSNSTVQCRQLITLDIDEGKSDMWELFINMCDFAGAMYTTHKHTPKAPRYRLLVPLAEEVSAEEYEAIARKIAEYIDIDMFDDTTFQPARFMYWPSTSKDGEYVFNYQDSKWLDGKALLKSDYRNWMDRSEWPYSSRQPAIVKREVTKQGNPTEKQGVVGQFCRCYDIASAIEKFLPDVYKYEGKDRYTFSMGSTANGLVVYDGMFAYSNHSTDPAGGKLCNAFDLVRLHKFGDMDDLEKKYQKPSDMPSFEAMQQMCAKDEDYRQLSAKERIEDATSDFEGLELEEATDLFALLETDKKGNVQPTLKNYRDIIEKDPRLKGKIAFDSFARQVFIKGSLPWRTPKNYFDAFWTNADDSCLRNYLNDAPYCLKASMQNVQDAFDAVMVKHSFHPIKDYINSAKWDGMERLDTLFIDYQGAEDTPLNRAMTRKAFVAAVARIFDPGCKWDYVLTLIGSEGVGKSTILAKMGGRWFSDSFTGIEGAKGMEQLQRVWILELGELSVYKKADVETMKAFLSKREDQYRPAYGRKVEIYPRECVFFASTNENNFLKGDTGNRRFWPMTIGVRPCKKCIFKDLTDNEISQLWAEAKMYYDNKEPLFLEKDMELEARQLQNEHGEEDDRAGIIEEFLEKGLPSDWDTKTIEQRRRFFEDESDECRATGIYPRNRISAMEILNECMRERLDDKAKYKTRGISAILKKMKGWKYAGILTENVYGRQKVYERINKKEEKEETK